MNEGGTVEPGKPVQMFFGLTAGEWAEADDWPICPWDGEHLTYEKVRAGIVAMLRRGSES